MTERKRHLAAIMFTDIVGYSALMGKEEDRVFDLLRKNRLLQLSCIEKHGGKWLKEMGDGILAKFSSAYDSVRCALDIQMAAQVQLDGLIRIGIHLGDVTMENGDVFGDGVNIASRLQAIADPGGIYITESVHKAIRGKGEIQSRLLGEVILKNIDYPIRIYSLLGDGLPVPATSKIKRLTRSQKKNAFIGSALFYMIMLFAVMISVWGFWYKFIRVEEAEIKFLAVLPFDDLSGDKNHDYLVAGIQDNLITTLSQITSLRIISKTSTVKYKNKDKSVPEIASELGVDAIIEASLMIFEDSIRINVQLIQAYPEEKHLWAQIFNRPTSNIYYLFNDVTQNIAEEINLTLTSQEKTILSSAKEVDPNAYQAYLRGRFYWDMLTPADLQTALEYYQLAIEVDPDFAPAYAGIAAVWSARGQMGFVPYHVAYVNAKEAIDQAFELDSTDVEVLYNYAISAGWIAWDWQKTEKAFKKVIELNPSHTNAHAYYSNFLMVLNRTEEAMNHIQTALKLDPYNIVIQRLYVINLFFLRRCDEIISRVNQTDWMNVITRKNLWGCYYLKGMYEKAYEEELARVLESNDFELKEILETGYKEGGYEEAILREAEKLEERSKESFLPLLMIINRYAMAKQKEKCLELLEKGFDEHDPNLPYITIIPLFDFLRDEPRFKSILQAMNLPE